MALQVVVNENVHPSKPNKINSPVVVGYKYNPWKSKDYFLNGFSVKTIVLVGIYNQQFKGTILFMVFDFQGNGITKE